MYILIISRGIPTKNEPQFGCFEKDQAEALASLGHKVVVVCVDGRFRITKRKIGITYIKESNIDFYESFLLPGKIARLFGSRLERFLKEYQINRLYCKVVKKHGKPDLIYAHFFYNILLGKFLKSKYDIPLVGIEHAARFVSNNLDKVSYKSAKEAYESSDKVIAVSPHLAVALNRLFDIEPAIVSNVYNAIFDIRKYPRNESGVFTFVSIGSLEHRKGFDILIKAFKVFHQIYNDSQLIIIGDGEEHNHLVSLAANCGLSSFVHFVGRKNKHEIAVLMSSSNIFVLPSRSETFGVVYIEAMALGLPVIGTRCGGPDDLINSKNGCLVPVDDVSALSTAMITSYEHYDIYDSAEIARECEENYSSRAVAEKLVKVFNEVIKNT